MVNNTKLSVNINKFATLRNARGGNNPNLIQVATDCEAFGAQGITVHPRPDQRHIRFDDVYRLKEVVTTEFNIEGNPTPDFVKLVTDIKPHQVTLVPDLPEALTSNQGWDTKKHQLFLKEIIAEFKQHGIRTSIFLDPVAEMAEYAKTTGTDRVELYTESYAKGFEQNKENAIAPYVRTAALCNQLQLGINAGHDLDLQNLHYLYQNISGLLEVSIGHALVCDALYYGLSNTIRLYKNRLNPTF